MVGTDVTIGQNQPLTSILLILESGDISTEMGSDICQVMICFFGQVYIRGYENAPWKEEDLYSQRPRVIKGMLEEKSFQLT
jgi:hypothetical protein